MWLQKKFLELFSKKTTIKNDQNNQIAEGENNNESVPDIFAGENSGDINKKEEK